MPGAIVLLFAFLYGACIGSFLNVCIFRLPRRCLRLWRPQLSFCPKCHRTLQWHDNLPLISYLILRGRCGGCKVRISPRYFFVELLTALFFLYIAQRCLVLPWEHGLGRHWGEAVTFMALGASLLVCAAVDAEHRIIPDEIDIPGFLLAPIAVALVPSVLGARLPDVGGIAQELSAAIGSALPWWGIPQGVTDAIAGPLSALHAALEHGSLARWQGTISGATGAILGAAAGAGLIAAIGWAGDKLFRSEHGAMGFGDVKFMAMIGGFTGWQGVLGTIVIASMSGSIWGITSKFATGRTTVKGKDVNEAAPLSYLALRIFGAPREAADDADVKLWPGGSLAARFATGEPYVPFGPFLALGALLCALWPGETWNFFVNFGAHFHALTERL